MPVIITTIGFNLYLTLIMLKLSGVITGGETVRLCILIFLVLESILVTLFKPLSKQNGTKSWGFTTISSLYLIFASIYAYAVSLQTSGVLQTFFFPVCLLIAQTNYRRVTDPVILKKVLDIQFYFTMVFAICFFITQIKNNDEYDTAINTVYYLAFNLPFVLQHPNKIKQSIGVVIIVLCVLWSMKRAPLISIAVVLIFFKGKKILSSKAATIILRTVVILIAGLIINSVFIKLYDIDFVTKLLNMVNDGGSGRVGLITNAIDTLKENTLGEWIFGHKLQPTSYAFRYGAHNDFLEMLYRGGIIGFVLYISYYVKVFKYALHAQTSAKKMLYASWIMFIIVSFTSQLFFLPSYSALIAMSFNFALCSENLEGVDE